MPGHPVKKVVRGLATFYCPTCSKQQDFLLTVKTKNIRTYKCATCNQTVDKAGYGKKTMRHKPWKGKFEECASCTNKPYFIAETLPDLCERCRLLNPTNYAAPKKSKEHP